MKCIVKPGLRVGDIGASDDIGPKSLAVEPLLTVLSCYSHGHHGHGKYHGDHRHHYRHHSGHRSKSHSSGRIHVDGRGTETIESTKVTETVGEPDRTYLGYAARPSYLTYGNLGSGYSKRSAGSIITINRRPVVGAGAVMLLFIAILLVSTTKRKGAVLVTETVLEPEPILVRAPGNVVRRVETTTTTRRRSP